MKTIYEYLTERNFSFKMYERCWIDEENCVMTVPIFSVGKRWVGYQEFRPRNPKKTRYKTWTTKQGLWGWDNLNMERGSVFLTEAVFRSHVLHKHNIPSLAVLGSNFTNDLLFELQHHSCYNFIWLGDPDKSGNKPLRYFKGETTPKDLDEMTENEQMEYCNYLREKYNV